MRTMLLTAAVATAFAFPALAQDVTTIQTADSDEYGTHLTTSDGRPVYLFTTDTQATESDDAAITCTSEDCLDAWPLVTTQGSPIAGDGADADMLATMDHEGQSVVTYNGWPLYHFARDEGADAPQGHEVESFGGEWYLVTPEGEELHTE